MGVRKVNGEGRHDLHEVSRGYDRMRGKNMTPQSHIGFLQQDNNHCLLDGGWPKGSEWKKCGEKMRDGSTSKNYGCNDVQRWVAADKKVHDNSCEKNKGKDGCKGEWDGWFYTPEWGQSSIDCNDIREELKSKRNDLERHIFLKKNCKIDGYIQNGNEILYNSSGMGCRRTCPKEYKWFRRGVDHCSNGRGQTEKCIVSRALNDCDWVAENPGQRCTEKDYWGRRASEFCSACNTKKPNWEIMSYGCEWNKKRDIDDLPDLKADPATLKSRRENAQAHYQNIMDIMTGKKDPEPDFNPIIILFVFIGLVVFMLFIVIMRNRRRVLPVQTAPVQTAPVYTPYQQM